jgi:hypothetical protein
VRYLTDEQVAEAYSLTGILADLNEQIAKMKTKLPALIKAEEAAQKIPAALAT